MPIIHRFDLTLTVSLLLAAGTGFAAEPRSATYLWWEAEEPTAMAHGTIGRFAPETPEGRVLSGSARLEPGDQNGPPLTATYGLHVPSDGTYDLWVRKFWRHGPFKWRFGDSEWQTCGREIALHDTAFIRMHEGADWVHLARLPLEDGPVRFEIESLDNLGWFDAFLLIDGPFLPAGRLKPGEKSGLAAPGFFAWEPDPDSFRESPIDLRHLNETSAGVNGPLRRDGKRFLLGDGTPVRFWMTQASGFSEMTPALADFHARRLAKAGVNMVRLYFLDAFRQWRAGESEAFALQLDRIHYAVATLKQQGIYTKFGHLHWDTHVHALDDDDLSGLKEGEPATAALFFNEPLQRRYLEWIAAVMTPVNPYTGLSLAEDPAVGIVEVQNESNTLFWTMHPERLPAGTSDLIRQAFARFAAEKYGSLAAALAHWGDPLDGDDPPAGRLGFLPIYELTARGGAAHANRAADQRECLRPVLRLRPRPPRATLGRSNPLRHHPSALLITQKVAEPVGLMRTVVGQTIVRRTGHQLHLADGTLRHRRLISLGVDGRRFDSFKHLLQVFGVFSHDHALGFCAT